MTARVAPSAVYATVPVTISDRSCLAATGLAPRPWVRALVTLQVPHARVGRRVLCSAIAWAAAVDRAAGIDDENQIALDENELVARVTGSRDFVQARRTARAVVPATGERNEAR